MLTVQLYLKALDYKGVANKVITECDKYNTQPAIVKYFVHTYLQFKYN